ncbi:hypothetical protein C8J27_104202 [Rhodobacter aestuarii]|uniref:DUF2927 domain-containing protein n=1 Tax=Rhodobacter aestuarii TaxID=453582 RepID=A0A1N7KUK4_9RHOB|nr:DUF2927 domain-containing protein [Rhodobacter aestuarii]PTV95564.1 hypothetical protein C8J27_104202 [Rhodobacter aestuarii]SIS65221.1 Protein of unknown function [Rhodobacter aestuarii]
MQQRAWGRISALGRGASTAVLCLALAGCIEAPFGQGGMRQSPRPAPAPDVVTPQSPESLAVAAYYQQIEDTLKGRGLLRTDVAPRDAPITTHQLIDDFIHIALYDEYSSFGGTYIARPTPSRLRRWQVPVRMSVEFGASVPLEQRSQDHAVISAYAGQLASASRHPVQVVPAGGNFTVFVVNEDERRDLGPRLQQLVPGIDPGSVDAITNLAPSTFCVVFAFSEGAAPAYSRAVAVIRAEHPPTLRRSCVHEELAQGLGLANDYPHARPSIFNDDEEFALLTRHDELLLRMLYDPRLRPGMAEAEARPIVTTIARELMGGS